MAHYSSASKEVKQYKRMWYSIAYSMRPTCPNWRSRPSPKRREQLYKRFLRSTRGVSI